MKLKTKKAMAKRFKFTGSGKVKFQKIGTQHNTGFLSRTVKHRRKGETYLVAGDMDKLQRGMPYGNA